MSDHTYQFNVKMACGGCSGAIDRVLKKTDGVKTVDISLPEQSVTVITAPELSYDDVYEKIKKTGKEIISGKTVE
ncbi:hypothetical protein DFH27DRAFT_149686 [Peziza echinospora]|nr:hypothetical protein DFH27DRAFT_149686 [Peziza echinospora]